MKLPPYLYMEEGSYVGFCFVVDLGFFLSHGTISLACKECSLMVRHGEHDFCSWLPLQCGSVLDR